MALVKHRLRRRWQSGRLGAGMIDKPRLSRLWLGMVLLCLAGLFLGGCVNKLRVADIEGEERARVTKSFERWRQEQDECRCCIDVAVSVTLKGLLRSGTVNGYLQAMSPAFLKFDGLNPLGQPMMILVTDGDRFQYLAVDQGKGYSGNVDAETFVKYAPPGFRPHESFYWLSDRLPPGVTEIEDIGRSLQEEGYWITVSVGGERRRVLFDPQLGAIRRHQVLDKDGKDVFEASYDEFRAAGGSDCLLPGRITVTTSQHRGTLVVALDDWLDDAVLSEDNFSFTSPPGFELVEVP